jgi:predicted phosphate transport protein (TIGR00153 family)
MVLFSLVTESIGWATVALLDQDVERAKAVIEGDDGIDARCEELVGLVKERLSTAMLEPQDLEYLVAVLQIVPELERSGDLAEHIAQRSTEHLGGVMSPRSRGLVQSMSEVAVRMWEQAQTAYRQSSRQASFSLSDADDELDDLANRLVVEGTSQGADPEVAVSLALIARFYERLGDHAVNLARRIDNMAAPRRLTRYTPHLKHEADAAPDLKEKRGYLRRALGGLSKLRVVPNDDAFFHLFRSAAENARDCAAALNKLVVADDGIDDEALEEVRACERRGDDITIDLLRRLDASFVTPYDREDIHALAEELDDVVDDMFSAATVLQLARDDRRPPELQEIADVIVTMCDEMCALIDCLESRDGARFRLERIEHLERRGDAIYQRGIASLFNGDYGPLEVIKLKDLLHSLESSCNAVEDVSDVIESILVKNS